MKGREAVADRTDKPFVLDRESSTPAHGQIESWLVARIQRGQLRVGDRLPAEREFAEVLGVSRMTLRQALNGVEQRGLLARTAGRGGGAVVSQIRTDVDLTGLAGFTDQMRKADLRATARLVHAQTITAAPGVRAALELAKGARVHEVVRVRSVRRSPYALERSFFPAKAFPDLLDQRLTGSLYALLAKNYGQAPDFAVEYLDPVIAGPDEAELLKVELGAALMLIDRTARSAAGTPVEYARDLFRPDRVRIMVRSMVERS